MGGVIDPGYQGEMRLLFHNKGKKVKLRIQKNIEDLLILLCPMIKVNEKLP